MAKQKSDLSRAFSEDGAVKTHVGGQALIEGILMRGPEKQCIVVRGPEGLVIKEEALKLIRDRYPILGLPLIRGSVTFLDSMVKGVKALMFSADYFPEEDGTAEPSKFEKWLDQKLGTGKTNRIFCVCWAVTMILSAVGMAVRSLPLTIVTVVMYACLNGGLGNLMPSMFIKIYGRYDFAQANKIGMPIVICLRSLAMIIMPNILMAAGADQAMGFRNLFVLISALSVIACILAFAIQDKTIGTETK